MTEAIKFKALKPWYAKNIKPSSIDHSHTDTLNSIHREKKSRKKRITVVTVD